MMPDGVDLSWLGESASGSFRNRKSLVHLTLGLPSRQESQLSVLDHSGVNVLSGCCLFWIDALFFFRCRWWMVPCSIP